MKLRKKAYGTANVVGRRIEELRRQRKIKQADFIARLQTSGLDINPTSYSKLEGQLRQASDTEIYHIARVISVDIGELFTLYEGWCAG